MSKAAAWKVILGFFTLVLVVAAIGTRSFNTAGVGETKVFVESTSATSPGKRRITAEEKVYFAAAGGYLSTAHAQGLKIANALTGAANGTATLTEIEDTIERAAFVENAGYFGDYDSKVKAVPAIFASVDPKVKESHRLFQLSMKEYKKFFSTHVTDYIAGGESALLRSADLKNKALNELTEKAGGLEK